MHESKSRLPAEWEQQAGVLVAWPHGKTDWRQQLDEAEEVFAHIVAHISRFETVLVATPETGRIYEQAADAGALVSNIRLSRISTNDTWARDFGPIIIEENGRPVILDFGFNGWGLKFAADLDNQVTRRLHSCGVFGTVPLRTIGMVLEGGSIECDGKGTILTTSRCLMSTNRNPQLSRKEIEMKLTELLGADRFLWLENGALAGDDTDSHIDTLARLCPDDTIIHLSCDDPADEHFVEIGSMVEELSAFRTRDGKPYRLIPLPWPKAIFDDDGMRLPATYANYLVINDAVLVPTYGDIRDKDALEAIGT